MKSKNESEWLAYCAGLFDGEGCFCIGKADARSKAGRVSPYYGLVASLAMTRRESMVLFRAMFGGNIKLRPRKPPNNDVWEWKIYGEEAAYMALQLLPFLRIKLKQARVAIAFQQYMKPFRWSGSRRLTTEDLKIRETFHTRMQELNKRGKIA